MTIGTGIAIAGAWVFAGLVWRSGNATSFGCLVSLIAASIVTHALM